MKILIIGDMEGISGVTQWDHVVAGRDLYQEGRQLYTEDINAAVRGAKAAGADEIVVVDSHGAGGPFKFNSIIPDLLEADCDLVAGHTWTRYTELYENGCDGVLLIGKHAKAGTPDGVLSHTVSSKEWRNFYMNETAVGEIAILAAIAGQYNVPVRLVSGDAATSREAKALLGEQLQTVIVKTGLSRFSARLIAPKRTRKMIEESVCETLQSKNSMKPFMPAGPIELKVEVSMVEFLPQYKARGLDVDYETLTASCSGKNWEEAWNKFWIPNPI